MKLALSLVLFLTATAAAAPEVVVVDVERDALGSVLWTTLPPSEIDPGGLVVPANADPAWFAIGLQPADVVRYHNGDPPADLSLLGDGVHLLELERNKKQVILRVTIHGPAAVAVTISESEYDELLQRIAGADPRSTVVRRKAAPSGVRVIDNLFRLELEVGDIVRTIDGNPVLSDAAFVSALRMLRVGKTQIVAERHGRPITFDIERAAPIDLKTVKRISATRFDIPQVLATALVSDVELVTRGVETAPVVQAGAVRGLRIFGFAPESLCAAVGLQNDDVLLDIEGRSIGSLGVFEAKHLLAGAPQFTIHIERKGKRLALTYVVR